MALTQEEIAEIVDLRERGLNLIQISRIVDHHWQTVRKVLMQEGLLKEDGTACFGRRRR